MLVGSASAIEPWTLGDLGGSLVGPSKVYDDLDTDVSIARRPEHSARSSAPKKEPVSLNMIEVYSTHSLAHSPVVSGLTNLTINKI